MTYNLDNPSLTFLQLTIFISLVVAAAFPIGALSSAFVKFPTRVKADIASFSAGIFLAAVTFSIIKEAVKLGNVPTTALGFAICASTFSLVRYFIQKKQQQEHNQIMTLLRSQKEGSKIKIKKKNKLLTMLWTMAVALE